ncbi:hypothetical protein ACFX2C_006414 [Malus domestica]
MTSVAVSTRGSHCRLALIEQVEWWILGHGGLLMRFFFCGLRHLKLYSVILHTCEKTVVRFACKTTKLCALCTHAASGRRGVYESKHSSILWIVIANSMSQEAHYACSRSSRHVN